MGAGSQIDLKLIDETYGKAADLYEDVLRVPSTATHDEIQLAYFDRRGELFTLLAKIDATARGPQSSKSNAGQQRYKAEKQMDSVVFAVRILADPELRNAYNRLRSERMGLKSAAYALKESPSCNTTGSTSSESTLFPSEAPPVTKTRSGDSKNWIQSTFSGSLFSNLGSKDDSDGAGDEEKNPRKLRRRFKKQSSVNQDEPARGSHPEGKKKRSIFSRKKKKKQSKEEPVNDTIDNNLTDTSMTDEDVDDKRGRNTNLRRHDNGRRGEGNSDRRDMDDAETLDDDTTRYDDETRTYDTRTFDDGETFATFSSSGDDVVVRKGNPCCDGDGMFGCISGSRAFKSIANEVSGACEDTLVSVDQVFNAFTLTDKDIKAVRKKINRAQKQLDS